MLETAMAKPSKLYFRCKTEPLLASWQLSEA